MKTRFIHLPVFVFLFQLLLNVTAKAQSKINYSDSLLTVLANAKDDTNKVNLYGRLISFYADNNYDSALIICTPGLQLAEKLKWAKGTAYMKFLAGKANWRKGNFDTALNYHFESLAYYKSIDDREKCILLLTSIGHDYADGGKYNNALNYFDQAEVLIKQSGNKNALAGNYLLNAWVQFSQGNNSEAIINNYKALKIYEEVHDNYGVSICLSNIADGYTQLGNYTEALKIYQKGITLLKNIDDPINLASNYISLGHVNTLMGNISEAINYLDTAYKIAAGIHNEYMMASALNTKGDIFLHRNNFSEALIHFNRAADLYRNVSNNLERATVLCSIGTCYTKLGNYTDAAKSFAEAKSISKDLNSSIPLTEYYKGVEVLDSATGDWRNAYFHYKNYIIIRDSTNSRENTKNILQQQIEYENQKKDALAKAEQNKKDEVQKIIRNSMIAGAFILFVLLIVLYNRYQFKHKTNKQLQEAYEHLQSTQQQLVQQEKLASLGALTAGIAHEIKNPLNFVNNFSELSNELIEEFLQSNDEEERKEIASDLKLNLKKINEHGKRADSIVKNMLEHSRSGSSEKQLTDINKMCEEYLNLAYHGKRAGNQDFNCKMISNFDKNLPLVNCVSQDISRVVLNLLNNAFDELKIKSNGVLELTTQKVNDKVEIKIKDNGRGIPHSIREKIFEPFFTTKPAGQGTGLGLSLSYDIIKAHGGEIKVESKESEGTEFIITLPIV